MADHRREIETEMHNDEMEIDLGRLFLGMWKSFRKLWWMVLAFALAGATPCAFQVASISPSTTVLSSTVLPAGSPRYVADSVSTNRILPDAS